MVKENNKAFSDYLYERSNNLLKRLRETNSTYQGYLSEIERLSQALENDWLSSAQMKELHTRYAELKDLAGDIENVYLFTKGIAEYKNIMDYVAGENVITDVFFSE